MLKQKSLIFLFFIFFLLAPFSLDAQQGVTLEAFVDKPTLSMDDQLILTVRVKGGNVFTEPSIPSRGNFEVLSRGSASHVEMINGRLSVSKEYTYVLEPLKTGTFEIGPISVFIEGIEKQAAPISVTVTEAENSQPRSLPKNTPGMPPGFPMGNEPMGSEPDPGNAGPYKDIFVTADVDNKSPYKGEQIIYTFRLYTSRGVGEAKLDLPDFHDFWNEEIQKEGKSYKELGGKRYVVSEFKVALFPTQAGPLTISPAVLKAQVEEPMNLPSAFNDPFFTMRGGPMNFRPRVLKTSEIALEVKALPPGAPSGFTGLVGQFALQANLSKKDLAVGDSATLTIQISGNGNIKDALVQPNFQVSGLKVYDDKPTQEIKKAANGISGSKTFKFALVPENPGNISIPSLSLSYFDPKKGTYESLTTSSYELSVVPGTAQEKINKTPSGIMEPSAPVSSLAEDIATIHKESSLQNQESSFTFYYAIAILFASPPLIFLLAYLVTRRQRWREENTNLIKKRKALSRALERIRTLDLKNASEISPQLSHTLKEYLGDKLSMVGIALTPNEVEKILLKDRKKHPAGEAFVEFLRELDAWVYGGLPQKKDWEAAAQKKAIGILKAVEKEIF